MQNNVQVQFSSIRQPESIQNEQVVALEEFDNDQKTEREIGDKKEAE